MEIIPKLVSVEAEMARRGIVTDKRHPIHENRSDLPTVVQAASPLETTMQRIYKTAMNHVKTEYPKEAVQHGIITGHWKIIFADFSKQAIEKHLKTGTNAAFRSAHLKGAIVGIRQLKPLNVHLVRTGIETISYPSIGENFVILRYIAVLYSIIKSVLGIDGQTEKTQTAVTISFDLVNELAVEWARENSGKLITFVTETQQEAVALFVEQALAEGRTVDQVARDIRSIIGLRPNQAQAMLNFRQRLVDQEVDPERIDVRTERYGNALLADRAEMIARTEIINSANAGQRDLWDLAADEGLFKKETAKKVWVATEDELLDPICEELDGEAVGLDEQFDSEVGPLDGPTAHPCCRCGLNIEFGD